MARATRLPQDNHRLGWTTFLRHPLACLLPARATRLPGLTRRILRLGVLSMKLIQHGRVTAGTGISTRCPSTTPVGLALGPDLPWADEPAPGTLGHPAEGFPTPLSLLMPAFSLVRRPRLAPAAASPPARRSPTQPHTCTQPASRPDEVSA